MCAILLLATPTRGFSDTDRQSSIQDFPYGKFLEESSNNNEQSSPISATIVRKKSGKWINPFDPLHAYPNFEDIIVHEIFQKLTIYEINNSEKVRTLINIFKAVAIIGVVLLSIALVTIAAPVVAVFGRRSDTDYEINQEQFNLIANRILSAIEISRVLHEM